MAEERRPPNRRVKTPTVLQIEAVECGAACLGMVLGYYGRIVSLEQLRVECGVSRDGSKASNINKAARRYGLSAKGYRKKTADLFKMTLPMILFWNFNHFVVLEGFSQKWVYINDPAQGRLKITYDEFDLSFTGIVLEFNKTDDFEKGGKKDSLAQMLIPRLRGSWWGVAFVVLASLLLVVINLIVPSFSRIFVDDILVLNRDWILALLAAMGASVLFMALLTWLQQRFLSRLETKLALNMSTKFFWHILRLPMVFFTQRYSGDLTKRIEINDRVSELLSGELATNMIGIVMLGFYSILMLQYDMLLTVIGISIVALNLVALGYFSRLRRDANRRLLIEENAIMGAAMNGLQIIETLKATGSESDFFSKWAGHHAKTVNAEQTLGVYSKILSVIPLMLTNLSVTAILVIGGIRVIQGELTVGMLAAFQALMLAFLTPVNDLVNVGARLQEAEGDLDMLDDVLRYERDSGVDMQVYGADDDLKLAGYIELRNVTFGYSRLGDPLLKNISLSLTPGNRVAFVGSSGSGKSTLAKVIAGLYETWEGDIFFDGRRRDEIPRHVMNNSLAMVDQDIFMFSGSVRENLTMWDKTIPIQHVIQAAKDAAIHSDIVQRSGGYESIVSEGGRNYSGGQKQRLEIARSLVINPTILIMDEATSALDPITEKVIDDNLRRRGCTCIIVAHRLSTIRDCDEIIVFDKGRIVQRGTHDEMINAEGPYAQLIKAEDSGEDAEDILNTIFDRLDTGKFSKPA
ncbi:MAG: NHLP family bacteriocin export ABC transporter peptidase/permease/ATPase subunit [Chloroflexi bacterium]|nr:NHLP family bacteriocin export ABC transporter peptidase/permease/ATPase subunit [Chloroflexota bacterium]